MRQEERRAQTTERLLESAAEVFGRLGFRDATVDDVAAAAGYTKGAVYANFGGKDALLLALIDRHLDEQLAAVDRFVGAEDGDLRAELSEPPTDATSGAAFGLLMLEVWQYAARNEAARLALAERYSLIRARLAEAIAERGRTRQATVERDPVAVASLVLAVDAGLFLQGLIDPWAIPPGLRAATISELIEPATPT